MSMVSFISKKSKICFVVILSMLLSSCSDNQNVKEINEEVHEDEYISFTVTKEENDELNMYIYTYNFNDDKVTLRTTLKYTAQYPLGVYSYSDNSVYYSSRGDDGCDELYRRNLVTGEDGKLTSTFFAINYIIPINDCVYVAAVERKTRAVGLFEYKNGDLNRVVKDKDAFVWKLNVNPDSKQMVFNTYSKSELDKNMEEGKNVSTDMLFGVNTIKTFNIENKELQDVATTKQGYITGIGLDYDGTIYYNLGGYYKVKEGDDEEVDELNDLKIQELVYLSENEIYFIDNNTSLVRYERNTKNMNIIYETNDEKEALNNAIVLW